ncbi:MAG: hypothetical protein ABFD89_11450 [Bryobacteraceae bacterium]
MRTVVITALLMLLALCAWGQTATPETSERYFVLATGGWGPATGGRGEGSVGIRIGTGIYSLTSTNLAGGVGAVTEDVLYRAATSRGLTLWGRAGGGVQTTNTATETSTAPTFGGGLMLAYDASKIASKLAGLEFVFSAKLMYLTAAENNTTVTTVRPMYQIGAKFSWQ